MAVALVSACTSEPFVHLPHSILPPLPRRGHLPHEPHRTRALLESTLAASGLPVRPHTVAVPEARPQPAGTVARLHQSIDRAHGARRQLEWHGWIPAEATRSA